MSGSSSELNILECCEIVRAGAGAGKTTQLTNRVMDVASVFRAQHGRLPKIVVTTFTRKATEELRERLLKKATESRDDELIEYVSAGRSLMISTIHGVLTRFLRQYGHLIELDANFTIVKKAAADLRATKILRKILTSSGRYHALLEHYTVRELVQALNASVTALMFHPSPQPVTLEVLTSTREAWLKKWSDEFRSIVLAAQAECQAATAKSASSWLETFEAYLKFLDSQSFSDILNFKKPSFSKKASPYSQELNDALKESLEELGDFSTPANEPAMLEAFARHTQLFYELRGEFIAELDESVKGSGALEMRDIERFSLAAIKKSPELGRAFGAEWDYWLIDEFQDTSPLQVQLLREFVGETPAYYVGDPQQSIYLFRGSRREVFEAKEQELKEAGGTISLLNKNFRSRPELLLFFNDIFSSISSGFMRMEPHSPPVETPLVATLYQVSKQDENPYAPLVQHLQRARREGERLDSFCVLARRHSELIEIARVLERSGLPTYVHSAGRFFERREILDLLSIVKFLLNPHDNVNTIRLLRSPWFHIDDADLARALERGKSHWRSIEEKLADREPIRELIRYRERIDSEGVLETLRAVVMDRKIVDHSHAHDPTGTKEANIWKFLSMLHAAEKTPGFQYLQFVNDALLEREGGSGDEEDGDAVAAVEPNRVNLMTIHKSKGLKFAHVILPNLHSQPRFSASRGHEIPFVMDEKSGVFSIGLKCHDPEEDKLKSAHSLFAKSVLRQYSDREREEYDRLFYVAMTRAERSVVLHAQEPKSGSWAQKLSSYFQPGRHTRESYCFEVHSEWPAPDAHETSSAVGKSERAAFDRANVHEARSTRASVTQIVNWATAENGGEVSLRDAPEKPISPDRLKRQLQRPIWGQKIHAYFEKLKYGLADDPRVYFEKWFGSDAPAFVRAAEYTMALREPPIRQLIEGGNVEWGFQLKTQSGVIEGQIDLWGVVDDVAWIVDYKSGSASHVEKAFLQLDIYTLALRSFGIANKIRCSVVYALDEKVITREARPNENIENELSRIWSASRN